MEGAFDLANRIIRAIPPPPPSPTSAASGRSRAPATARVSRARANQNGRHQHRNLLAALATPYQHINKINHRQRYECREVLLRACLYKWCNEERREEAWWQDPTDEWAARVYSAQLEECVAISHTGGDTDLYMAKVRALTLGLRGNAPWLLARYLPQDLVALREDLLDEGTPRFVARAEEEARDRRDLEMLAAMTSVKAKIEEGQVVPDAIRCRRCRSTNVGHKDCTIRSMDEGAVKTFRCRNPKCNNEWSN
jgi:DNA-directed RNA polymerase subunit M/transcription elongation factor TFIIS